jgi:uncharacterized membrane protein
VSTLAICKFDSPDGAERALRRLERLGRRMIAVQEAAVVAWTERDPKPRAYQARSIAGPDPLSSAFWASCSASRSCCRSPGTPSPPA